MLTIKNTQIKNSISELTVKQYEHISAILNDAEKNYIDKWSEIFIYLGVDEDIVDSLMVAEFIELIQQFNIVQNVTPQIKQVIKLNDVDYYSYKDGDEFKITVKEMALIENAIKHNDKRYIGDVLAILYKNPDSDKTINFDKTHIHYKAELIRKEITADVAIPILNYVGKIVIKDFELIENESN
jgi:hypothetical protein